VVGSPPNARLPRRYTPFAGALSLSRGSAFLDLLRPLSHLCGISPGNSFPFMNYRPHFRVRRHPLVRFFSPFCRASFVSPFVGSPLIPAASTSTFWLSRISILALCGGPALPATTNLDFSPSARKFFLVPPIPVILHFSDSREQSCFLSSHTFCAAIFHLFCWPRVKGLVRTVPLPDLDRPCSTSAFPSGLPLPPTSVPPHLGVYE